MDCRDDFGLDPDSVWINTAHQGALPRVAAEAAREAIEWKLDPRQLTQERFDETPERLRRALARLISADTDDIVLTSGASYGVHLLANGLPLGRGDEVLLMKDDFPSNRLPWRGLAANGVEVRQIESGRPVPSAEEIAASLRPATRVLSMSWVHSFSGYTLELVEVAAACRANGTWLVLNVTQGLGARPFDVGEVPVDALVCAGWKWLCGPYGTGFCWLSPALREQLDVNQAYWLAIQSATDLGTAAEPGPEAFDEIGARRYDVFGTANFFNFVPFTHSVEYLLARGVVAIEEHVQGLVARLVAGVERLGFEVVSPRNGPLRSSLVLFEPSAGANASGHVYRALLDGGVHGAFRRGRVRLSPHLYNDGEDVERVLSVLSQL